MKNLILLFLLTGICILSACKKDIPHYKLGVTLFEGFEQDKVQIFIDGKEKLNDKVQTNHPLGIAFPSGFAEQIKKGKHTLKVIINDSVSHKDDFAVTKDLCIGVLYDRQKQIIPFRYGDCSLIPLD